jgi:hypothetical protein
VLASADWDNWVALGISALIVLYLIAVIVFPERF